VKKILQLIIYTAYMLFISTHVIAQQAPSEWSSAPCSSVALGPSTAVSHVQRIFFLAGKANTIQYRFFADEKCTQGLYSLVIKGPVEIGKPVAGAEGAVEVKVTFERVLFTLDSPRAATAAKECADGNFEVGVQRDVTAQGCLFVKPKAMCGVDYDIMKIKDGQATPGFRTADMCKPEGRPSTLQFFRRFQCLRRIDY
jgi:Adenomatosis polyposis coli down-regulated 1